MVRESISKKESNRRWREKNKEYIRKYNAVYRQNHIEQIKELIKRKRYKYPEYNRQYARQWRMEHREYIHTYQRNYDRQYKIEVLTHYGKGNLACVICGERRIDCLSIHHINGNGAQHRRDIGVKAGGKFYQWLKKQGFPDGYRTLCMNCQYIERENLKRKTPRK